MIKDKQKVIDGLIQRIEEGYDPCYEYDPACGYDWLVLSKEEFSEISKTAKLDRTLKRSSEPKVADILGQYFFPDLVNGLIIRHKDKGVDINNVCNAVKTAISVDVLINNLAEVFRISGNEVEQDLISLGLSDLIRQFKLSQSKLSDSNMDSKIYLRTKDSKLNVFPELFRVEGIPESVDISSTLKESLEGLFDAVASGFCADPFIQLCREDVIGYFKSFMLKDAQLIIKEINRLFDGGCPKYMITTGIGANEQFTHFAASLNNKNPDRKLEWLVINSPKNLSMLPRDASVENTLFVEFSRSSLTEETVKIHEYTPRNAKRIVFSNGGPLFDIAKRDGNLTLSLPDQVSGRYGRNKTPILLAPMLIAGMDVEQYWKDIDLSIKKFDITDTNSLPFLIAKAIMIYQKVQAKNFIYLGCNDDELGLLADQFLQFWNEGVNKSGNDLLTSRFFGLPRDSHMNIEGILGNKSTKMGLFLLKTNLRKKDLHPMISSRIDPVNPEHAGLQFGDEEVILAMANYRRFSELMPSILIEIPCEELTLAHSAVLGQLFADVTFIYSRLAGIDPGSNPEVKFVRERSAKLLSSVAEIIRNTDSSIENAIWR